MDSAVIASNRRSPIPILRDEGIPEGQGAWRSHVKQRTTRIEITTSLPLLVMTTARTCARNGFFNMPFGFRCAPFENQAA